MLTRQRITTMVAVLLMLVGALLCATDIIEASVERRPVSFNGPLNVQGQMLRLQDSRTPEGFRVDLIWGEDVVTTNLPITPDPRAGEDDYEGRYANQIWLYAPDPVWLPWHLVVVDRSARQPRYTRYLLNRAAPTETQIVTGDLETMRRDFNLELLRRPERQALHLLLPPPALILLGALILLLRPGPRISAAPTLALVLAAVALSSLVAWPVMMHVGPARSLPPALLALGITLLVALGFGPRWQLAVATKDTSMRIVQGVAIALILLAVCTIIWVQIHGFMAPIFRPPGAGMSPGEWFMHDMVAPTFAVGGLGLIPAILVGVVYGVCLRRR